MKVLEMKAENVNNAPAPLQNVEENWKFKFLEDFSFCLVKIVFRFFFTI